MAGQDTLVGLITTEAQQRQEEGCDTAGFAARIAAAPDEATLLALYAELQALTPRTDFPFVEPSAYPAIQAACVVLPAVQHDIQTLMVQRAVLDEAQWQDKFLGAWLGRCAGCALGKPLEYGPYMGTQPPEDGQPAVPGWRNVQRWFMGADAWPMVDYTPEHSRAEHEFGLSVPFYTLPSIRGHIRFMQSDDDLRYTILGLLMLEEHGTAFDALDVGLLWRSRLPMSFVYTAEMQSYLNLANVVAHGHERPTNWDTLSDWVRTHLNPYREWIGAQIRADGWAYGAAGHPQLAAELAWRDASFSHVKNGIYGAMFTAAVIAAAFTLPPTGTAADAERLIAVGLAQIPDRSRLVAAIQRSVAITLQAIARDPDGERPEDLVAEIWNAFSHYHPVHTINNAALVVAALLYACGTSSDPATRYTRGITTAVLGGWDTDCNGATVGSILGALVGAAQLPANWVVPLHDTIYAELVDFHPIAISSLAQRSQAVWRKLYQAEMDVA